MAEFYRSVKFIGKGVMRASAALQSLGRILRHGWLKVYELRFGGQTQA